MLVICFNSHTFILHPARLSALLVLLGISLVVVVVVVFVVRSIIIGVASLDRAVALSQLDSNAEIRPTYRNAILKIKKYQKRFRSCKRNRGAKTWYFIHGTSQAPVCGAHCMDSALNASE